MSYWLLNCHSPTRKFTAALGFVKVNVHTTLLKIYREYHVTVDLLILFSVGLCKRQVAFLFTHLFICLFIVKVTKVTQSKPNGRHWTLGYSIAL